MVRAIDAAGNVGAWVATDGSVLDKDPPGKMHGDVNEGPGTVEVIVVELQK